MHNGGANASGKDTEKVHTTNEIKRLEAQLNAVATKLADVGASAKLDMYQARRLGLFFGMVRALIELLMEDGINASRLDVKTLYAISLGKSLGTGMPRIGAIVNVRAFTKHRITHSVSFILNGDPGCTESYSIERISFRGTQMGSKDPTRYEPNDEGFTRALLTIEMIEQALEEIS